MTTPNTRAAWMRRGLAFLAAWLLAAAWGSVAQTHWNLQALAGLGIELPMGVRATTTLQDLVGFGPAYAAIVLAAWVPAYVIAALSARRWARVRTLLYASATGIALVVAIRAADAVAPMPVLIDATRGVGGLAVLALGSALGGGLFARWTRPMGSRV
ncbi:hypothetical protein CMZ84_05070 [Lysobacteraceae bacterium NML93-0399]|nr:hypothetical protein CMZ84_05070 [Xanthomonadaceae bacterium NML93-0399]